MQDTASITLTPRSREEDAIVAKDASTPSPTAVQEFTNTVITDSNASDVVSDAIFGQLGVVVTDSEVIEYSSALALPELTECGYEQANFENNDTRDGNYESKDDYMSISNKYSLRSMGSSAKEESAVSISVGQRLLQQALSSLATSIPPATEFTAEVNVGHERQVIFHTNSLGIRLNRGIDGYVRIVSSSKDDNDQIVREGDIFAGDIVREVNDVDLRSPIDMAVWKMTIALMKMAPRPLTMTLAEELPDENVEEEDISNKSDMMHACNLSGERKKSKSATRAFVHLKKQSFAVDSDIKSAKVTKGEGIPPSLEELSEEHLASIELDQSRDAMDDFDECLLTPSQINNLL